MARAISRDDGGTGATLEQRFEALKRTAVPPDYQQEPGDDDLHKIMDLHLYKATKEGDVNKFVDALEDVSKLRKLALSLIFAQVTPSGNSLLHVAASFGKEDVMELIHSHSPHLMTHKNYLEDTPLHVAVRDGRLKVTKMLISQRGDSDIMYWENKDSKSPLYLATENCLFMEWPSREKRGSEIPELVIEAHTQEKMAILDLLLEKFEQDGAYANKIQGMSPVFLACERKDKTALLEEIIDRLPKLLHVRDKNGGTPLHFAAAVRSSYPVNILLEKCPLLALQTDVNGSYPIHIACQRYSRLVFLKLLESTWSANLAEIKNKKGRNILHVAAEAGDDHGLYFILEECSKLNITKKLVNSEDVDGNTPLHLASMHNHCEVIRSLTKVDGIFLAHRNNGGLTALDVAMESSSSSTRNSALVGRAILIVAGVPRSKGRDVLSPREQGSRKSKSAPTEWIKDQVDTLLVVATLVASVTFAAGLTLPGGHNASGDLHPGTATMLHHGMFQVFIIANMVAMYSSILAVVVLLWGLNRDFYVAELAYHSAGPLLLMALTGMSVAFFAAVTVVVSKLTWLGSLVLSVGVLYLVMVMVVLAALIFPSSKTTMRIVVLYYIVVSLIHKFVTFWVSFYEFIMYNLVDVDSIMYYVVKVYDFIMYCVVTVCKRIRDSYGRCSRGLRSPSSTPPSSSHQLP